MDAIEATTTVAPSSDALGDQIRIPDPVTNTIPFQGKADLPPDARRDADIDKAINDALGPDDGDKPAPKPKVAEPVAAEKPEAKKAEKPPSGFDDAALAEWEAVPESVRGAVHRRTQEMERGIEKYRVDAQAYEPIKPFAEMAKASGTTVDVALNRYINLEQKLRADPLGGLQEVVANLNLKKADGTLVIMGQSPDETASRQEATIMQLSRQLQAVTEQLSGFSGHVQKQQEQAQYSNAEATWSDFQSQYPRAVELQEPIAEFLTNYPQLDSVPVSERLQIAYSWASSMFPNVAHTDAAPLVQTQIEATPSTAGRKSISGSPGGIEAKTAPRNLSSSSAVEKAMRAVLG
jgi:hypothetical protein